MERVIIFLGVSTLVCCGGLGDPDSGPIDGAPDSGLVDGAFDSGLVDGAFDSGLVDGAFDSGLVDGAPGVGIVDGFCGDIYMGLPLRSAAVTVFLNSETIAVTVSDDEGYFQVELEPGTYRISCRTSSEGCIITGWESEVIVESGQTLQVSVMASSESCF